MSSSIHPESKSSPEDKSAPPASVWLKSQQLRYHCIRLISCPIPGLSNDFPVIGGRTFIEVVIIVSIFGLGAVLATSAGFEDSGEIADVFCAVAVLFGLRNNILELVFGISFERALYWHKMVSFSAILITLYHSLCGMSLSGLALTFGMIVMSLSYFIRHVNFEWFYYVHVSANASFIFFGLIHFSAIFFAAACVIWLIDLTIRYIITKKTVKASVKVLPADIIRLEFPKSFKYEAGQYCFLRVGVLNKIEYHPMSISSCPEDETITVHIRELGDWTSRLGDLARQHYQDNPDETFQLDIEVEGPYGKHAVDMHAPEYEVYMLISGGIGITPMQSLYNSLIRQVEAGRTLTKVLFLWSVRDRALIESIEPDILSIKQEDGPPSPELRTPKSFQPAMNPNPPLFFVKTSKRIDSITLGSDHENMEDEDAVKDFQPAVSERDAPPQDPIGEALASDKIFHNMFYLTQVSRPEGEFEKAGIVPEKQPWLQFGRPDLADIFKQCENMLLTEPRTRHGRPRVAVGVCGPQAMVDDVRNICKKSKLSCSGVVFDCHSEVFDF